MISELQKLAAKYQIAAIYAFGSRAKEIYSLVQGEDVHSEFPDSDVDIGILPTVDKRLTLREKVKIAAQLEDLFEAPRVDLVVLPEASPFLALEIVRGELLLAADPDLEAEYQLYVLRRVGDLAGWEKERQRMLLLGEAI